MNYYNKIENAFNEAIEIIHNLSVDDFSFRIGNCIKTINCKEIIETSKKKKTIEGNTIYKFKLPDLYDTFSFDLLEKMNFDRMLEITEDNFKQFKKENFDFDEIEIKCSYITAVLSNENIKKKLLEKIRLFSDDKNYIQLSSAIETMYGLVNWNIPFLYDNTYNFADENKKLVFIQIQNLMQDYLNYANPFAFRGVNWWKKLRSI